MTALDLICPAHGGPLRENDGALQSDRGEVYPVVGGVAVIVQGVRVEPQSEQLAPAVIDQLLDALVLPAQRRPAIEQVFSHKFSFVEDWIQTEADQFLNRVAASHEGLRRALHLEQDAAEALGPANVDPSPALSSIFTVSKVRPGTSFSVNLRLENTGSSTLSSNGPTPIMLSYHWVRVDQAGAWRALTRPRRATIEGHRTPLLDDLLPGRAISVPIFVAAPTEAGSYELRIRALQEGVTWFEQTSVVYEVEVGNGPATTDDPAWTRTEKQFDYMGDHFEAVRLLTEWSQTLFDRPVYRVVELGGNANPMIDHFDAPQKYNVDIDPFGMIIGNLVREGGDSSVKFIVADGMALPMPPRSVDMLVMFATYHHFPDPIGLLSRLSDFVTDDGLLCLMCEPIGHVHRDTLPEEYLGEIRKGVNEQSFALWEYQQMFDASKLDVVAAQIDVGSAKFALRPRKR